jgi:hypothetical protein
MAIQRIDFRLRARVNDAEFEMNGFGVGDRAAGTCELHLTAAPAFPEGFDPVSCPMVCSHPTSLFFAANNGVHGIPQVSGDSYEVNPGRDGVLYNGSGELVMHLSVTGKVYVDGDTVVSEHTMTGFSRLPRIAKTVTPFDDFILPDSGGSATAIARYKLLALSGETFDGITTVPYRWTNDRPLTAPLRRRVENIQVDWDGGAAVHAYYTTSVRPITSAEVAHLAAASA